MLLIFIYIFLAFYVIAVICRIIYDVTLFLEEIENTTIYTKDSKKENKTKLDIKL